MSTLYDRMNYLTQDEFGVDPLSDRITKFILDLPALTEHSVAYEEQCRPDRLAETYFGSSDLWWVILIYNKLISVNEMYTGRLLRIPEYRHLSDALVYSNTKKNSLRRIVIK